jgi:hypothetical protein
MTPADIPSLVAELRELLAKATPGVWRVGRQNGAQNDHLVDMGEPPNAPYFRMHKGLPEGPGTRGSPAFGIVESDDASAEEIAANAALIVAMKNALPALLDVLTPKEVHSETGWLVEMVEPQENKPPCPRWWHPEHGWMWDANKALRFAREVDATDYVKHSRGLRGKATEHMWGDA